MMGTYMIMVAIALTLIPAGCISLQENKNRSPRIDINDRAYFVNDDGDVVSTISGVIWKDSCGRITLWIRTTILRVVMRIMYGSLVMFTVALMK